MTDEKKAIGRTKLYLDRAEHACNKLDEIFSAIDELDAEATAIKAEGAIDQDAQLSPIYQRIQYLESRVARWYLRLETCMAQMKMMEMFESLDVSPKSELENMTGDGQTIQFAPGSDDE